MNYNSNGSHIKKPTNGQTYFAYLEYGGDALQRSDVVILEPGK